MQAGISWVAVDFHDQVDCYSPSLVEMWLKVGYELRPPVGSHHTFVISWSKYVGWHFLSRSWFLWPGRLLQSQPGGNVTVSGLLIMASCWLSHTFVIGQSKYAGWDFLSRSWFYDQVDSFSPSLVEMWL